MAAPNKTVPVGIAAAVIAGLTAVGSVAYILLVNREEALAKQTESLVETLQAEIDRGRGYLTAQPDDQQASKEVERVAAEVKRRVPIGRNDLAVAEYYQKKALEAGLEAFRYDVVGGMALPEEKAAVEQSPYDALALDSTRLNSVTISVTVTGSYQALLAFLKAIADAPWIIQVDSLDLRRPEKTLSVQAKLSTRYLHQ